MTGPRLVPGLTPALTVANIAFTLGSRIGVGQGMNSEVFLATDQQLDAQLVMKKMSKASLGRVDEYFAEARRLHDARHRNVVDLKYACEEPDTIYLAMPYYRRGTLHTLLDSGGLTVREIVRRGLEFLSGLHHVHVKNILHLDIKPTNILLDDSDIAALGDFGLSREITSRGVAEMPYVYVPHIPPERLNGLEVSRTADIYQAGVTLYRMCVGNSEFERQIATHGEQRLHRAVSTGTFPNRDRMPLHIPPRLRDLVVTAMETRASDRFQTVLDLMNALALVDESLDWRYEPSPGDQGTGKVRPGIWRESSADGRGRRVTLSQSGGVWQVDARKISVTNREQRAQPFCQGDLSEFNAGKLVRAALKGDW